MIFHKIDINNAEKSLKELTFSYFANRKFCETVNPLFPEKSYLKKNYPGNHTNEKSSKYTFC